jgi:hypothetical protein
VQPVFFLHLCAICLFSTGTKEEGDAVRLHQELQVLVPLQIKLGFSLLCRHGGIGLSCLVVRHWQGGWHQISPILSRGIQLSSWEWCSSVNPSNLVIGCDNGQELQDPLSLEAGSLTCYLPSSPKQPGDKIRRGCLFLLKELLACSSAARLRSITAQPPPWKQPASRRESSPSHSMCLTTLFEVSCPLLPGD